MQPVHVFRPHEHHQNQNGADGLTGNGGNARAGHAPVEHRNKQQVQHQIQYRTENEKIQGPPGIARSPENTGAHVIEQVEYHAAEINLNVHRGVFHHVFRRTHGPQCPG